MLVIVEGIDRVGKTTFIDRLKSEDKGLHIFKHDKSIIDYSEMNDNNEADKMVQLLEFSKYV